MFGGSLWVLRLPPPLKLVTMFYVIADTLLKVVNMFYAIANIVESGIKHQ
jgi:hypothetical protein